MKKQGTILTGPDRSGKSLIANTIGEILGGDEVMYFDGRGKWKNKSHTFSMCERTTKCIVIDDIYDIENINYFISYTEGIMVNKKSEPPFNLNPYIILIFDSEITKKDLIEKYSLIELRFEIIDLTHITPESLK